MSHHWAFVALKKPNQKHLDRVMKPYFYDTDKYGGEAPPDEDEIDFHTDGYSIEGRESGRLLTSIKEPNAGSAGKRFKDVEMLSEYLDPKATIKSLYKTFLGDRGDVYMDFICEVHAMWVDDRKCDAEEWACSLQAALYSVPKDYTVVVIGYHS